MTYARKTVLLIAAATLLKLPVAALLELGNDEAYYWTYALLPQWNYFDHPPMVGLLIRLTTLDLLWVNELSMRVGPVIGCAISTWLIFLTGRTIGTERTGWLAALIYNCSLYTGILAGLFILPDAPLMPFWCAALYLMSRLIFCGEDQRLAPWLLLGLAIGLATLCKVHALFLWAGFGLFLLGKKRAWLLQGRWIAAAAVTAACVVPIVCWNIAHSFITYRFHAERVTHTTLQWAMLAREIGGEFVYQNPVISVIVLAAMAALLRKRYRLRAPAAPFLLCLGIPMILTFWAVSLFNPTLPHWSGPAYLPLFLLAARYLEETSPRDFPRSVQVAGVLLLAAVLVVVALARFAPFHTGSRDKGNYGEYCFTLDISGWKDFAAAFHSLVQEDAAAGRMKPNASLLSGKWFPGGHLEFYVARTTGLNHLGIGPLDQVHHFAWLNERRRPLLPGDDAYCVVPSNLPFDVSSAYGRYFRFLEGPVSIAQRRGGSVVRIFQVYRLKECLQAPETALPAGPGGRGACGLAAG